MTGRAEMNARRLIWHGPWPPKTAELLRDGEARLKPVLMKARAEMRPAEPHAAIALQRSQSSLSADGGFVEHRMLVIFTS